jgi:hypothetical protein
MVAFEGREPVGVLLGAKRPESTLVHTLRVHPEHRRRGHGRHLLTSLSQKLAILGPPRLVAEIPAGREGACAAYLACGWTLECRLTDWRREAARSGAPPSSEGTAAAREALHPVSYEDLAAAGLLSEARSWRRETAALSKHRERLSGLAFHSPDRIEAWVLWDLTDPDGARPLLALGGAPGPLGRLGLSLVLDEVGRLAEGSPLLLPRAAPEEFAPALLTELGFAPGGEHLLFTSRAQAA